MAGLCWAAMSKRSDESGRAPPGGTIADEAALQPPAPAPVPFAKTELPLRTPTPLPIESSGDLPTISHSLYKVSDEIARGGLGRILRARHRYLDRTVAIKEGLRGDDPAQARFIREALITARLQHPSIIPVYEAGRWPTGEPFYAMKLVSGRSLSAVIEETKTLEERLAFLPNVIAVADAIAYAHSEHIIHRDLKPDNILVGAFGETVVIDWGLAKDLSAKQDDEIFDSPYQIAAQGLTMAGAIMGTPEYMAPEQAQAKSVDERSDVYAIGCILYHVLVGDAPFRGTSAEEIITKVLTHTPTPLQVRAPGVPHDLATVVHKAMARDPANRYTTAKGLAEDLRRFQTGQLVSSKQYTAWQLVQRWARRHRTVLAVVAAALVLLVTIGAVAITNVVRERAVARSAQTSAEARTNQLILVQARSALDSDPAEALAWLKTYPRSAPNWSEVHEIAIQAQALNPARHIFEHRNANAVDFSSDGTYLVSWGRDKEVRLWNIATGSHTTVNVATNVMHVAVAPHAVASYDMRGTVRLAREGGPALPVATHTGSISQLVFSRNARWLASADVEGTIKVIDTTTLTPRVLAGSGAINALTFSNDNAALASGGDDHAVRVWDLASGAQRVLRGHTGPVTALAFGTHGQLASAAQDNSIRVFDVATGTSIVIQGAAAATKLQFLPDDETLVSIAGNQLTTWSVKTGKQLRTIGADNITTNGRSALLGFNDGQLRVLDLVTGDEQELHGQRSLLDIAIAPDGRHVAAIGLDRVVRVWPVSHETSHVLSGHSSPLRGAMFSPRGDLLATASVDGAVGLWTVAQGAGRLLRAHQAAVIEVAFSPDGKYLASTSYDKTARLWTVATGESRVQSGYARAVRHPTFSRDGHVLFTSAEDGTLRRWYLEGDRFEVSSYPGSGAASLELSPDGRSLAAAGVDGVVRLWDVETWTDRIIGRHVGDAAEARFLPDGGRLISRAGLPPIEDRTIRLWDLEVGTGRTLFVATAPLVALAISPDGNRIAFGGQDPVIRVMELTNGSIREYRGHTDTVKTLRFSSNGHYLASASYDNTVRLWELTTGASQIVRRHRGPVWDVLFSPDGRLLASTSFDTTAWVGSFDPLRCLSTDPDQLLARIHEITTAEIRDDNRSMSR